MRMQLTPDAVLSDHCTVFTFEKSLSVPFYTSAAKNTTNVSIHALQASTTDQSSSSRCFIIFILALLCIMPNIALAGNESFGPHYGPVFPLANRSSTIINMSLHHDRHAILSLFKRHKRSKRTEYIGRHQLSQDLIEFVCDRISDPCIRAAFLRLRVYHRLCTQVPLIYLLPYVSDTIADFVLPPLPLPHCTGLISGLKLRPSDGLYSRFLLTRRMCRVTLSTLDKKIRNNIDPDQHTFDDMLSRSFCSFVDRPKNRTGDFDCDNCRRAYSSWLCSTTFPVYFPVDHQPISRILEASYPHHLRTGWSGFSQYMSPGYANFSDLRKRIDKLFSQHPYQLINIPACRSWCTEVETLCPYLPPDDSTSMGGEPTFQCGGNQYQYAFIDGKHSEQHCCFTSDDLLWDSQSIEKQLQRDSLSSLEKRCFLNQGSIYLVLHNESKGENFFSFHLSTIRPSVPIPAQNDARITRFSRQNFIFAVPVSYFLLTVVSF